MNSIESRIELIKKSSTRSKHKYKCDKCKDTHIITTKDETGHVYARNCDCMAASLSEKLMRVSGISPEDVNIKFNDFKTFNNVELKYAKSTAFSYCRDFKMQRYKKNNSLFLSGLPGRGKTMLGFAVCNNLIRDGIPVQYISYRDVVTRLKQNITNGEEYSGEISRMKDVDALFIDDLFKGKITESDINIVYELVNYRYLKRKPIIVSSEKTANQLLGIDEAIGSRIIEMCKDYIIEFKNCENYRLRSEQEV